jgi:hypothetical protein
MGISKGNLKEYMALTFKGKNFIIRQIDRIET